MPAILSAVPPADSVNQSANFRKAAHLKAYQFQPGHAPLNGGGRPKGSRNSIDVLLDAAPKIAKAYVTACVKDRAPGTLNDARKWIMPIDSDAAPTVQVGLLRFLEAGLATTPSGLPVMSDNPQLISSPEQHLTHTPTST